MPLFLAATAVAGVFSVVADIGWEKLVFGKIQTGEYLAGIIGGVGALFLGYTEVIGMNQKLNIPLYLHNREKSQSNGYAPCAIVGRNIANVIAYTFGYGAGQGVKNGAGTDFCRQSDRLCNLNIYSGKAQGLSFGRVTSVLGGKDLNVTVTTKKNYLFVEGCRSLNLGWGASGSSVEVES